MKRVFVFGDVTIESDGSDSTLSITTGDLSLADENQASITLSELHVMDDDGGTYVKPAVNGRSLRAYDSGVTKYCEISHNGEDGSVTSSSGNLKLVGATLVELLNPLLLYSTRAGRPPTVAPSGQILFVSDESGGAVPAFSDVDKGVGGSHWRRFTDRAIIS